MLATKNGRRFERVAGIGQGTRSSQIASILRDGAVARRSALAGATTRVPESRPTPKWPTQGLTTLGCVPAPRKRRAGRYRAHLLLQAGQRDVIQALLSSWVPRLAELKRARCRCWSLDADLLEMF
ncbi:MAG: hypothetical protein L0H73_18780 [Nitrococcus sp.]|nr:hypothetical protein [Nitrococcus sp.]